MAFWRNKNVSEAQLGWAVSKIEILEEKLLEAKRQQERDQESNLISFKQLAISGEMAVAKMALI